MIFQQGNLIYRFDSNNYLRSNQAGISLISNPWQMDNLSGK